MVGDAGFARFLTAVFFSLCFVFLVPGLTPQAAGTAVEESGTLRQGVHYFPNIAEVSPRDALSGGMRPLRKVVPGETGTLLRVTTSVYRVQDGRRLAQVPLTHGRTPGMSEAYLWPGTYDVVILTINDSWQWVDRPPWDPVPWGPSRREALYLVKETQFWNYEINSYRIEVVGENEDPHPCDDTAMRDGVQTADAEIMREVLADAIGDMGARIGPEHIEIYSPHRPASEPGWDLLTFTVRLQMTDNQPRHNWECLVHAMETGAIEIGSLIGAGEMVFGMVQQAGGQTLLTMRRVEVETSLVLDAGMSTVDGTGRDALAQAASEAAQDALSDVEFH